MVRYQLTEVLVASVTRNSMVRYKMVRYLETHTI